MQFWKLIESVCSSYITVMYIPLRYTIIPQWTVDNNLGPDRLASPKALDPNYCRQPILWLHDLCLEVLTVHATELRLFGAKAFPLLILISCILTRYTKLFGELWTDQSRSFLYFHYTLGKIIVIYSNRTIYFLMFKFATIWEHLKK